MRRIPDSAFKSVDQEAKLHQQNVPMALVRWLTANRTSAHRYLHNNALPSRHGLRRAKAVTDVTS